MPVLRNDLVVFYQKLTGYYTMHFAVSNFIFIKSYNEHGAQRLN